MTLLPFRILFVSALLLANDSISKSEPYLQLRLETARQLLKYLFDGTQPIDEQSSGILSVLWYWHFQSG